MCRRGNGASPPLDHLQLGKLPTFNISELMADNVRAVPVERALPGKHPRATLMTTTPVGVTRAFRDWLLLAVCEGKRAF